MPVLCGGACVAPQAPNCATIIDSGTSLLVAPTAHVGALLDLVEEEAPGVLEKLYKQTTCAGVDVLEAVETETASFRREATGHSQLDRWQAVPLGCSPHSRGLTEPLGLLPACLVPP